MIDTNVLTKNGRKKSERTPSGAKTKVCSYCGKRKPRIKFAKGRMCEVCKSIYDHERYLENRTQIIERMGVYQRTDRGRSVNRAACTKHRQNGVGATESKRAYGKTKANPTKYAEFLRKHRANNAVQYALKTGRLIKGICEVCGSIETHAHHDDYEKRLDVQWLCPIHHQQVPRLQGV